MNKKIKKSAKKAAKFVPQKKPKVATPEEIVTEIALLQEYKSKIPPTTMFGDSNIDAIDAEIKALTEGMDEDEAFETWDTTELDYGEENQKLVDAALAAINWRDGQNCDRPSDGWRIFI